MVIDLTQSEKRTFLNFIGLYLGSSFLLIILIAFFYYQNEKRLYFDLTKSNMQNIASKISSKIILAHMQRKKLNMNSLTNINGYKIAFYDKNKKKIFGNIKEKINFNKVFFKKEDNLILVDSSPLGHLGIYYIVIKENSFFKQKEQLKFNIALIFLSIYIFIAIVGIYLSKLFLMPIKRERERLNNFIKDTTHELNTPISALIMSAESPKCTQKQMERIRISAKRVSQIYNDLSYIFLQNHKVKKEIDEIFLDEVIEEELEYFKILAKKKRIKIVSKLEKFKYKINKDDFIRLINNLLSNSIKYNKTGGEIEVTLTQKGKLTIKDTGIGIDKTKVHDIFKRYYRANEEQGGFGIGLNIVKHISQKYNIKIEVNSKLKQGTVFELYF